MPDKDVIREWIAQRKRLKLEPAGEQHDLFGGKPQQCYKVSAVGGGPSVLLLESEVRSMNLHGHIERSSQTSLFDA